MKRSRRARLARSDPVEGWLSRYWGAARLAAMLERGQVDGLLVARQTIDELYAISDQAPERIAVQARRQLERLARFDSRRPPEPPGGRAA